MHWTEHFARYGFAVSKGLVDRAYCEEALAEIRRLIDNDLPLNEWSSENTKVLYRGFFEGGTPPQPVLDDVFEQPRLRAAIEEMYGGSGHWNELKNYYIFLRPFDVNGEQKLAERGHIDFGNQPVPALYRGFTFQVSLVDTEPFSGNLTIYPGTHIALQKQVMENPKIEYPGGLTDLPMPAPYEFVAQAGDVLWMHHLVVHSANSSHADNRSPRVALHCEAFRDEWLHSIDPAEPDLSPWQRSLAHNGAYEEPREVVEYQMGKRKEYLEQLRRENQR
jgi:hypothetical protein